LKVEKDLMNLERKHAKLTKEKRATRQKAKLPTPLFRPPGAKTIKQLTTRTSASETGKAVLCVSEEREDPTRRMLARIRG
jgi:hypothetical protein